MHQMMIASRRCLHHSSETPASRSRRWVFAQVAVQTDGEHDGVIAAGAALAGEDVIDDGGVRPDSRARSRTFHIVGFAQCLKKYGQGLITGGILIEIRPGCRSWISNDREVLPSAVPESYALLALSTSSACHSLSVCDIHIYTSAYMEQPAIIRFSTGVGTRRSTVQIGIRTDMTC